MADQEVFRFLDLPPELRNRVYNFYLPKPPPPALNPRHRRLHPNAKSTFEGTHQLARVNRQIRNEFLSEYLRGTNIYIDASDAGDYVQEILDHEPHVKRTINVTVSLSTGYLRDKKCELYPLLRYLRKNTLITFRLVSPDLEWTMDNPDSPLSIIEEQGLTIQSEKALLQALQDLVDTMAEPLITEAQKKWVACVENALESVFLRGSGLNIRIKKAYVKRWMNGHGRHKKKKTKAWMQEVGLPGEWSNVHVAEHK